MTEWQENHYKCKRPPRCAKFTEKQFTINSKMDLERGKIKTFQLLRAQGRQETNPKQQRWGKENMRNRIKAYKQLLVLNTLENKEST